MANGIERTRDLSATDWTAIVLTVIGSLNWGLVGLFRFDLVAAIFGPMSLLSRLVYVLVALAGVYLLVVASTRFRSTRGSTTGPASQAPSV
ncbi:MAG TPA: DUF378 domain-containing protein [Polyangiaceae bacterium]